MNMDYREYNSAPARPPSGNYPLWATPQVPQRRRRWPWILLAATVVVGLIAVGAVVLLGRDSRFVFGTANADTGTVEISSGPGADFESLQDGDSVRLGDTLRTGEGARATLILADGSVLRLGESSQASFEQPQADKSVLRLAEGDAWYRRTPQDSSLVIEVATKKASIGGSSGVAAIDCEADGRCSVQAIAGSIDLIPVTGNAVPLAPGERASLDEQGAVTEVQAVSDVEKTPEWVTLNREVDEAAGLPDPPASSERRGALAGAHVAGSWAFALTVTESTADNFTVGQNPKFDFDLVSSCPDGPCDFEASFDRYTGTGSQADDATVTFSVGAPLLCVNTASGAVTNPDNGPELLSFELRVTAAELTDSGLVATALAGSARYEKNAQGLCHPGDQVGPAFAVMDATGTLS